MKQNGLIKQSLERKAAVRYTNFMPVAGKLNTKYVDLIIIDTLTEINS